MYIDLTQTISSNIPVYPGDPAAEILEIANLAQDGFVDHKITMGMHVGTHLDAPQHFIESGKNVAALDMTRFFGRGVLIDARRKGLIDVNALDGVNLTPEDIVLVWTDWSQKFGQAQYYIDYPRFTEAFAHRLAESNVKIVGIDGPSPDYAPFAVHKLLLNSDILIIENLTNLEPLAGKEFEVIALPAKFATNAAPVRVVAKVL